MCEMRKCIPYQGESRFGLVIIAGTFDLGEAPEKGLGEAKERWSLIGRKRPQPTIIKGWIALEEKGKGCASEPRRVFEIHRCTPPSSSRDGIPVLLEWARQRSRRIV